MTHGHGVLRTVGEKISDMKRLPYAEGHSYDTLTEWLNGQSIPYLPGRPWN